MSPPMDMRTGSGQPKIGDLVDRLVDEGGNLLQAEIRIAEAKLTRRMRMAAAPSAQLATAAALALVALAAFATALTVAVAPYIGFLAAVVVVGILATLVAIRLYLVGSRRLRDVFEMPRISGRSGQ